MAWLDACRVFAALGVVLIHSTADRTGLPYAAADTTARIGPMVLRAVAELSGSELFFLLSLFLLAFGLDQKGRSYGETVRLQAKRLLVPFATWTLFYAAFRLIKADYAGYAPTLIEQLGQWQTWANYLLLGTGQYHLHFLPTLFALILLYPVMEVGRRFPLAGLAIFPLIYALDNGQGYVWGHVSDPVVRDYLLRIVKIACYTGYGFAAFSLQGLFKRRLADADWAQLRRMLLMFVVIALMAKLAYTNELVSAGKWGVRPTVANYAHFLMPLLVFSSFLTTQKFAWSPRAHQLARYTFGVYLMHPIFIDLYDVAMGLAGVQLAPTLDVLAKWLVAVPASFALAYAVSTSRSLAWTIGLGPLPFSSINFAELIPVRRRLALATRAAR